MILATRRKRAGNALMEYAVPMAVVLIAAGVLGTVVDIQGILGDYFMAASGHSRSALNGSTFRVDPWTPQNGTVGNGAGAFSGGFGAVRDGGGATVAVGAGRLYNGAVSRASRPQAAGGNGTGFAIQGTGPMYDYARQLQAQGAPQEYVSRVLAGAMTNELLSRSKLESNGRMDAYNQALKAQMAATLQYAAANMDQVMAHGGTEGLATWSSAMRGSVENTRQINQSLNELDNGLSQMRMQRYQRLREEGGAQDILNADRERLAVLAEQSGIDSALQVVTAEAAFDVAQDYNPQDAYGTAFFQALGNNTTLMNSAKTQSYVYFNGSDLTKPPVEAAFAAAVAAEQERQRQLAEQQAGGGP